MEVSLNTAYEQSLTEGYFIDTVLYLYSRKKPSGKVHAPRPIYSSSKMLISASPFFARLLSGTFREGRYGNLDGGFPEDEPESIEDYEYDSDSDLEVDEEEEEELPLSTSLHEVPSSILETSSLEEDTFSTAIDADESLPPQILSEAPSLTPAYLALLSDSSVPREPTGEDILRTFGRAASMEEFDEMPANELERCPSVPYVAIPAYRGIPVPQPIEPVTKDWVRNGRIAVIRGFAYTTCLNMIRYIGTKQTSFAPLKSLGGTHYGSQFDCSPKSMYRLAHMLEIDNVKRLALDSLRNQLQPTIIFPELFSHVGDTYPEVAQVLTDYFIQHRKDGQVIRAAPEWVRKLSSGQYADRVSVFGGVFARLLVVSDYNQASPVYY